MDYTTAADYGYYYSYEPSPFMQFINLALTVAMIAGLWKMFQKAGKEGWEAIVPFYSTYVMFNLVGMSGWRLFTLLIPFYNIYVVIKLQVDLAKAFGKSGGFAAGMIFLPFVFYPLLGFGDAVYTHPFPVKPEEKKA